MVTERNERLSAWMDDQGSTDTYDEVVADDEAGARWHRYHLIGDAMRNELPPALELDIASRVAAQLESEPTLLAPKAKVSAQFSAQVIQLGKRFGQYAIAASVAAVAVLGVQQYGAEQTINPVPVLETMPLLGAPSLASYQMPGVDAARGERISQERQAQEQQRRASAFLRDHLLQQRLNGVAAGAESAQGDK